MLKGKKTYIGGIGTMLVGIGNAMVAYYNGTPIDWNIVCVAVFGGLSIIGFRSKMEQNNPE